VSADPSLDDAGKRQARRDGLNWRKKELTALSSARWANAIVAANDGQYRLSQDAQDRHIAGLRTAIAAIEKRLAQPTSDTLTPEERAARKKGRSLSGCSTQAQRFAKQRRLQSLRAELTRVTADRDAGRVRVTVGGRRLAKTRHSLQATGLNVAAWREAWEAARWRIEAIGSGDEPFGNLTITVTSGGEVSIRLPRPLEPVANAKRGRYVLSGTARFSYRQDEWLDRITGGKPVSYRPWTSTTGTSQSVGSTRTVTRSAGQSALTSASPGAAADGSPRSGTRSRVSSDTPSGTASGPSPSRT
jgi:hypothetical protein